MNELSIAVPTVEQVNLEHQLANNKANEAVQHAVNCGLMLLQIKATKQHGEWLPWLNAEIDSGRLHIRTAQARVYMRLASNVQRAVHLENTSIRQALEMLSDKEPETDRQVEIDLLNEEKAKVEIDKERWREQAIAAKKAKDESE